MSNYHIFLSNSDSNLNDPACLIDGRQTSSPACNTLSRNILKNGSKYEFSLCIWRSCSASNDTGGALKCIGTATKLYLESCSFTSCSADREGGAIHTSSIHTLDVKDSLFYACSSSTEENDKGSGAIWIYGIQQTLSISQSSFISCTSKASGGAFKVNGCSAQVQGISTINNCRFISCKATDTSPDGGAVWIRVNDGLIGILNCLFSLCYSGMYGGAIKNNQDHSSRNYPIRYCFFNKNSVPSNGYGNDIYFIVFSEVACLHCFSTTTKNRIGYVSGNTNVNTDVNWLP